MYLGSELNIYNSRDNYLVDALKLSLSISPYSIPCDTSSGIEVERDSDIADVVRYRVMSILKLMDPTGTLRCSNCRVVDDIIYVEITNINTEEILTYSFL